MDVETALRRMTTWASEVDGLDLRDPGDATRSDSLTLQPPGADPIELEVIQAADRIIIRHALDVPVADVEWETAAPAGVPSFREAVERSMDGRVGLLECQVESDDETHRVALTYVVYLDGLSRHSFMDGVAELAKARRALDRLRADMKGQQHLLADLSSRLEESRREYEEVSRDLDQAEAARASATASGGATAAPADGVAAPASVPAWSATHVVAVPAMQAWASPDPSAAAVTLQEGVELQVLERWGDWAHVLAANGWTGWVDGRLLRPVTT